MLTAVHGNPNYDPLIGIKIIKTTVIVISRLNCANTDGNDQGLGQGSMGNSEGGSSTSSRMVGNTNTSTILSDSHRPLHIANLEMLLKIFIEMADFETAAATIKDKEVASQNVSQVFAKLTWRHLAGLEAIAICL
jgi:hypothetical protein